MIWRRRRGGKDLEQIFYSHFMEYYNLEVFIINCWSFDTNIRSQGDYTRQISELNLLNGTMRLIYINTNSFRHDYVTVVDQCSICAFCLNSCSIFFFPRIKDDFFSSSRIGKSQERRIQLFSAILLICPKGRRNIFSMLWLYTLIWMDIFMNV